MTNTSLNSTTSLYSTKTNTNYNDTNIDTKNDTNNTSITSINHS